MAATLGLLLYREARHRALSSWLAGVLRRQRSALILVTVVSFFLGTHLLQPGNIGTGDAHGQISSAWVVRQSIEEGWPFVFWSNYTNLGGPAFQFHNSALYYICALASYVIGDFDTTNEIVLLFFHTVSGMGMYLFVSRLSGSRMAGLVSAVAWGGVYYRYFIVVALSRLPDGLFADLWPIQLWLTECAITERRRRWPALLALVIGFGIWTHVFQGGWGVIYTLCYAAVRLLSRRVVGVTIVRGLWNIFLGGGLGVLISLYPVIPTLAERHLVDLGVSLHGFPAEAQAIPPISSFVVLDKRALSGWENWLIGNSIVVAGIVGGAYIAKRSIGITLPVLVMGTCSGLVLFGGDILAGLLQWLPGGAAIYAIITYRGSIHRFVLISALCVLAGLSVRPITRGVRSVMVRLSGLGAASAARKTLCMRVGLLLAAILSTDLVGLTLHVNLKHPDSAIEERQDLAPLITAIREDTLADTSRAINVFAGANSSYVIPMLTGRSALFGHTQDAPINSYPILLEFVWGLRQDLERAELSLRTLALLRELNIGYIIGPVVRDDLAGLALMEQTDTSMLWRVQEHSPLNALDDAMLEIAVAEHTETNNTVTLTFHLPRSAHLQLAYTSYPYLEVLLDGEPVETITTDNGLIGLWVEAGTHTLVVHPKLSPLRQWTLFVSAASALVALIILFGARTR